MKDEIQYSELLKVHPHWATSLQGVIAARNNMEGMPIPVIFRERHLSLGLEEIPQLTREAIDMACTQLSVDVVDRVAAPQRRLELCIFMESEWKSFVEAGFTAEA